MSKGRQARSILSQRAVLQTCYSRNICLGSTLYVHGGLERVNLQKKMSGSDTYIFDVYIPLGIGKRPNENIRSMS